MSIFSFIFEDNGVLYNSLNDIERIDGANVLIHPVWFTGYEDTTFSEELIYSEEQDLWLGSDPEHSWASVLTDDSIEIHVHDLEKIVFWNDMFFHCEGDLIDYWAQEKGEFSSLSVHLTAEDVNNDHNDDDHNDNNIIVE